jgi:hypothetical protein
MLRCAAGNINRTSNPQLNPETMEKLPEELHREIFSMLDHDSLKTASRVNKNWRSTIFGSGHVMKNAKLHVHDYGRQKSFVVCWQELPKCLH